MDFIYVAGLAALEGVDNSYVSWMMNSTNLAPDIGDDKLHNVLPDRLTLFDIAVNPAALWEEQRWQVDHL